MVEEIKTNLAFFNNKWKAIKLIGEGSYGKVYKAKKEEFGIESYSAIKQIELPYNKSEINTLRTEGMTEVDIGKYYETSVKKWIEEIELMLIPEFKECENIVRIEDYEVVKKQNEIGWTINIRMEELTSLDKYELKNSFTDKDIIKMGIDVASALEVCESKKVVHRDIKPENIFRNGRGVYKVGDFGVAKHVEQTISNMSKKGTENYMAPELYQNKRGNKTVDIYSLGIMLYKYFNYNRLPFLPDYPNKITVDDREEAIYKRIKGEEKLPPPKNASREISEIILKACSYYQKDRYQCANELKSDLVKVYNQIKEEKKLVDFNLKPEDTDKVKDTHNETVSIFSEIKKENKKGQIKDTKQSALNSEDEEKYTCVLYKNPQKEENDIDKDVDSSKPKDEIKLNSKNEKSENTTIKNKNSVLIPIIIVIVLIAFFIKFYSDNSKEKIENNTLENNTSDNISNNTTNNNEDKESTKGANNNSVAGFNSKMKKSTMGNLIYEIPEDFHLLYGNKKYSYKDGDIDYTIEMSGIWPAGNYKTAEDTLNAVRNVTTTLKMEFGDNKQETINGLTWTEMDSTTYHNDDTKSIGQIYVIHFSEMIYLIEFHVDNIKVNESSDSYTKKWDKIKKSLTLTNSLSRTKNIEGLQYTVYDDLDERGITFADKLESVDSTMFNYYFWIDVYDKSYAKYISSSTNPEAVTINENIWEKSKEESRSDYSDFSLIKEEVYYVIEKNDKLYKVTFGVTTTYKDASESGKMDRNYFEKMMNSIMNSIKF